jgi:hypothetical protein
MRHLVQNFHPIARGGSGGQPIGWPANLSGKDHSLPSETHALVVSNATYNPMGFNLTIAGQYSCTMP